MLASLRIPFPLAAGYFLLDISQMWKEDVYYEAFLCELEANGLHPEPIWKPSFNVFDKWEFTDILSRETQR